MHSSNTFKDEPTGRPAAADDAEQEQLMRTIEQAALAMTRAHENDDPGWLMSPKEHRRLRVPQDSVDDGDESFVAEDKRRVNCLTLDQPTTDTVPGVLPATEKRAKDEVDVAAAGVGLEVRRFQCTKSTLALKEATKNDATAQSSKLVDYIVSLTSGSHGMCTDREMCEWLVAQLCDRMETGQIWVMAKTYALLSALLWRGSSTFVAAVHEYGKAMFQVSHIERLIRSTPQENLPGTRLPCSLQPIQSASAAQKSACGKAKPHPECPIQMIKRKACAASYGKGCESGTTDTLSMVEKDMNFFITNVAYMESLCEYRMRHPTLDLAHGEILLTDSLDCTAKTDPASAAELKKTHLPTVWKDLVDDTLELMKAIASTDTQIPTNGLATAAATSRVRESVLLYQVACRALARMLHAVITVSHTLVASIQAGLQVPSSNLAPSGAASKPPSGSFTSNLLGAAFDPSVLDYSLTPDMSHAFVADYYYAIYQFNRTVNMLRTYCQTASHLDAETSKKALAAFKLLPEDSIVALKKSRTVFEHPECSATIGRLFRAAQRSAAMRESDAGSDVLSSLPSEFDAASRATETSPMSDEEVQRSMLAVYKFHLDHEEEKERMLNAQVDTVCSLFDEAEAKALHCIFKSGVDRLWEQWRDFMNNGAAAAEKALMSSNNSAKPTDSNTLGLSSSDNAASGDRSSGKQSSTIDSLTKSSTYILRSLPFSVRAKGSPNVKSDVISVNRSSLENSTESAIDALLLEDDVVVICNEECSCNDKLKLIDRFQVLMDVPLGEGSYGKVYRAWDEVVGCYLAAKELQLDASKAHNVAVREVLQEYTVLTELSHPNIVRVVAFMVLKQTARIYMEWMPSGSLQDVLRHHPRGMLRESVVRRYARDVLSGLAFLHSRGVIHRDVKPGNMLLSSDGAVKLTDFGTSLVLSGNSRTLESNAVTGTAAYMAPECVQGTYSSASDIWSFGCSLVQLISGNVPWCSPFTGSMPEPIALLFKIGSLDDATHLERPHDVLKDVVQAGRVDDDLTTNPSSVPSSEVEAEEAGPKKPSSKDGVDAELLNMLDSIFVVDRKKRPSASELLQHPFFKMV